MPDPSDLWTPSGMSLVSVDQYGRVQESGTRALGYKAAYRCPSCPEDTAVREFTVAGTEEDSQANIEDILGAAMERDWESHVVEYHQFTY